MQRGVEPKCTSVLPVQSVSTVHGCWQNDCPPASFAPPSGVGSLQRLQTRPVEQVFVEVHSSPCRGDVQAEHATREGARRSAYLKGLILRVHRSRSAATGSTAQSARAHREYAVDCRQCSIAADRLDVHAPSVRKHWATTAVVKHQARDRGAQSCVDEIV